MAKAVLIDSGPLVAALWRRDRHHHWARSHFEAAAQPFLTCEAVISESFHLLESFSPGKERLSLLLERGSVLVGFSFVEHRADVLRLMKRYADTPMSFADACLVRMTELAADSTVFTVDNDFLTYRRHGRQSIPVLMP